MSLGSDHAPRAESGALGMVDFLLRSGQGGSQLPGVEEDVAQVARKDRCGPVIPAATAADSSVRSSCCAARTSTLSRARARRRRVRTALSPSVAAAMVHNPGWGLGWTSAAAEATSQPVRSSWAALQKASHAMVSASATLAAGTVSTTVTRT